MVIIKVFKRCKDKRSGVKWKWSHRSEISSFYKSGILDFVHGLYLSEITLLKLGLLPSSGKERGGQKPLVLPPRPDLRLAHHLVLLSVFFLSKDGRKSRFCNVVIYFKYRPLTRSKIPLLQNMTITAHLWTLWNFCSQKIIFFSWNN